MSSFFSSDIELEELKSLTDKAIKCFRKMKKILEKCDTSSSALKSNSKLMKWRVLGLHNIDKLKPITNYSLPSHELRMVAGFMSADKMLRKALAITEKNEMLIIDAAISYLQKFKEKFEKIEVYLQVNLQANDRHEKTFIRDLVKSLQLECALWSIECEKITRENKKLAKTINHFDNQITSLEAEIKKQQESEKIDSDFAIQNEKLEDEKKLRKSEINTLKEILEKITEENDHLKKNKLPFLDSMDEYYAPEVAIATKTWVDLFGANGTFKPPNRDSDDKEDKKTSTDQIGTYLCGLVKSKQISVSALKRLKIVCNPRKYKH